MRLSISLFNILTSAARQTDMEQTRLTESYIKTASNSPLLNTTFNQVIAETSEKFGDRDAFVFCDETTRVTFKELAVKADKVGAGLLALGLKPGDRLVIWAPCSLEWVLVQFACIRAGILYTGLNPAYPPSEAADILDKLNPKCIVTGARFKSGDAYSVVTEICPELKNCQGKIGSSRFPELDYVVMPSSGDLNGITPLKSLFNTGREKEHATILELEASMKPTDPMTIQLTSGTTGCPKAVVLSHGQLANTCFFIGKNIGFDNKEQVQRLCIPSLMFRCAIMMLGSLCSTMYGLTSVIPSKIPNPEKTLKAISTERCTHVFGNPPMLAKLLQCSDFETCDLSSLTTAIVGGSYCALNLMKLIATKLHLQNITVGMPMTEVGGIAIVTPRQCSIETKCQTVGLPLDHLEMKVTDKSGCTVPINTAGELCVRGFATPVGYFASDNIRLVTNEDGWFNTGDMVCMDENGHIYTMGRKKDVIVKGNDVIYPNAIEEKLARYSRIAAVEVVGVPRDSCDQVVCACVVAKEELSEEDVKAYCRQNDVLIPDHVCFVEAFPKTLTLKVRKHVLADQISTQLGL